MHLVREFPSIDWNVDSVYKLLQKVWVTGSVDRHSGSADDAVPAQLITPI